MSVYASDGAVIFGVPGRWQPGQPPTDEWLSVRRTFWYDGLGTGQEQFVLGDFAKLARFFASTQSLEFGPAIGGVELVESTEAGEAEGNDTALEGVNVPRSA